MTMLAFGWRGMFMLIGVPGMVLSIAWYAFYRNRKVLFPRPSEKINHGTSGLSSETFRVTLSPMDMGLFRLRTMWGMMLGFGGINYTVWLYMSWMPNYLEAQHHVSVAATGGFAMIPFAMGALGMFLSGVIADYLVRHGIRPIKTHKNPSGHRDDLLRDLYFASAVYSGCTRRFLGMGSALCFTLSRG